MPLNEVRTLEEEKKILHREHREKRKEVAEKSRNSKRGRLIDPPERNKGGFSVVFAIEDSDEAAR